MRILLTLLSLLVVAPGAADTGSWYADDGRLGLGAVVLGTHVDYVFDAHEGDVISATLDWDVDDGRAYMVLQRADREPCAVVPAPDVPCLLGQATGVAGDPLSIYCLDGTASTTFLDAPRQTLSRAAPADGRYVLGVFSGLAVGAVDYHLHLQVDGAAPGSVQEEASMIGVATDGGLVCQDLP